MQTCNNNGFEDNPRHLLVRSSFTTDSSFFTHAQTLEFLCRVMEKLQNYFSALSVLEDEEEVEGRQEERGKEAVAERSSVKKTGHGSKSGRDDGSGGKRQKDSGTEKEEGGEKASGTSPLRMPLVWIDLEMTGLDLEKDRVLEIACIVTDGRLGNIIEGPDLIIKQAEVVLAGMGEWCQEHHTASGLVEGVRKSTLTEGEAEQQVLEFVQKHTGHAQPLLAGNSVYMDLMFLRKYMPTLAARFSHVLVDVSSVRALCVRWYPKDAERAPGKKQRHRALDDIKESIEELKYLRKAIFRQPQR